MIEHKIHIFESLRLDVQKKGDTLVVQWLGKSTAREPILFLEPFFKKMLLSQETTFEMDFKNLTLLNSSTITPIVKLLIAVNNSNKKILVKYDTNKKWQELNFSALMIFQKNDGKVQIIAE